MVYLLIGALTLGMGQDTLVITLEDATRRALDISPAVAAARGAIHIPRGERAEAFWPFPDNPAVSFGRVRRRSPGTTVFDREWSITQSVGISGDWLVRTSAAGQRIKAAEELVADAERRVRMQTSFLYLDLAIAERQAALADSNAMFAERLAQFARRQMAAGEINRLEQNTAILEAARARSRAERARANTEAAAAQLHRMLGLSGDPDLRTSSLPAVPVGPVPDADVLLGIAWDRRPDLRAATFGLRAAGRDVTAARLSVIPQLTVSLISGREDGTDRLRGFAIGFSVPLFHNGQQTRGLATAGRAAAAATLTAVERALRADVVAALSRFHRARNAERRFASDVLRAAADNVALTETALTEGEVSLTDVVVLRSAAVNAQIEYLDVRADLTRAWFALAGALDLTPHALNELLGNPEDQ